MRIQISQIRILIQRILLDIQSRRVDMCTENAHTSGKLFRSYMKQSNDLLHPYRINLVTGLDLLAFFKLRLKRFISGSLCFLHDFCNTFPFCFPLSKILCKPSQASPFLFLLLPYKKATHFFFPF